MSQQEDWLDFTDGLNTAAPFCLPSSLLLLLFPFTPPFSSSSSLSTLRKILCTFGLYFEYKYVSTCVLSGKPKNSQTSVFSTVRKSFMLWHFSMWFGVNILQKDSLQLLWIKFTTGKAVTNDGWPAGVCSKVKFRVRPVFGPDQSRPVRLLFGCSQAVVYSFLHPDLKPDWRRIESHDPGLTETQTECQNLQKQANSLLREATFTTYNTTGRQNSTKV